MADISSSLPVSKNKLANSATNPIDTSLTHMRNEGVAIDISMLPIGGTDGAVYRMLRTTTAGELLFKTNSAPDSITKNEDQAHASGDAGVMTLAVRTDTPVNRSGFDGDYEPLQVAAGRLWVSAKIDSFGVALPAGTNLIGLVEVTNHPSDYVRQVIEDGIHVSGDPGVMALAVRKAVPANVSSADGDYEPLQVNAGRLWVSATVDAALPAGTNNIGDVDVLSVIPGTGVTNLGKSEGSTHTGGPGFGDVGVLSMGVRGSNDFGNLPVPPPSGDRRPFFLDADGRLHVSARVSSFTTALPAGTNNIGDVDVLSLPSLPAGTNNIGDVDVLSLPSLPAGANNIGDVGIRVGGAAATAGNGVAGGSVQRVAVASDNTPFTVKVSKDANANSELNPIFVQSVETAVSGGEIHNYNTAVSVAAAAASNHDYTVTTAKTLMLRRIFASASGAMKVMVQAGPVLALVTKAVGFSSMVNSNIDVEFNPPVEVPATSTGTVRLIRTNRDDAAMDVYSTIMGTEV